VLPACRPNFLPKLPAPHERMSRPVTSDYQSFLTELYHSHYANFLRALFPLVALRITGFPTAGVFVL